MKMMVEVFAQPVSIVQKVLLFLFHVLQVIIAHYQEILILQIAQNVWQAHSAIPQV